jgi:hypothetical protein
VQVDFSVPFVFLEKELKSAIASKNNNEADKLVQVTLKNGEQNWVFVHIEFENSHKPAIKVRMYDYYSRIKEAHGQEITAIAIFTGRRVPKDSNRYEKSVFGTTIRYEYNTYAIVEQDETDLEANPNPFAIAVLANLYVLKTYNDDDKRLELKKHIYNIARQRGYPDDKTHRLILFLTELVKLPPKQATEFKQYITEPQKLTNNMYTTQVSRDLVDALAQKTYGKTFAEMDATIIKAITHFYEKMQYSIDQIADTLQLEKEAVVAVLKKYKLIKK